MKSHGPNHCPNPGSVGRGYLAVLCWCESSTVGVTPDEVRSGMTRSCGLDRCDTLHAQAVARNVEP